MAKKKLHTQMADQAKKQELLSAKLQDLFKRSTKGKQKQKRGNPNKKTEKSQCPEIIIVESYANAMHGPNPHKIAASERESATQKKLERESAGSGDTVTTSLGANVLFNFGCDYGYPVEEFREFFGLEIEDCFGSVFDGDYLAMKKGSGSYFRGQEASVGHVEYSTDDMLKEFLKENLFSC